MAEDIIERCAHAILADYERQISTGEVVHEENGNIRLNASALVRAVMNEMRDVDAYVTDAGNKAMRNAWKVRGLSAPELAGDAAIDAAWRAMIDAMLEEG